jgi:hypothetical protein
VTLTVFNCISVFNCSYRSIDLLYYVYMCVCVYMGVFYISYLMWVYVCVCGCMWVCVGVILFNVSSYLYILSILSMCVCILSYVGVCVLFISYLYHIYVYYLSYLCMWVYVGVCVYVCVCVCGCYSLYKVTHVAEAAALRIISKQCSGIGELGNCTVLLYTTML